MRGLSANDDPNLVSVMSAGRAGYATRSGLHDGSDVLTRYPPALSQDPTKGIAMELIIQLVFIGLGPAVLLWSLLALPTPGKSFAIAFGVYVLVGFFLFIGTSRNLGKVRRMIGLLGLVRQV